MFRFNVLTRLGPVSGRRQARPEEGEGETQERKERKNERMKDGRKEQRDGLRDAWLKSPLN